MHIESNRVQFNGTRVVPSGEALMSEAIKREERIIEEGTYWQIWDPAWFHTILERTV